MLTNLVNQKVKIMSQIGIKHYKNQINFSKFQQFFEIKIPNIYEFNFIQLINDDIYTRFTITNLLIIICINFHE